MNNKQLNYYWYSLKLFYYQADSWNVKNSNTFFLYFIKNHIVVLSTDVNMPSERHCNICAYNRIISNYSLFEY